MFAALRRPLIVLTALLVLCTSLVLALIKIILPASAPRQVEPVVLVDRPLSQHVLFVVVDGLRYDFATDEVRMPRFSRAMKEHASAELWAGRVTMTTSAILSYGTAQRGRFEQIVRNINPDPPPFHSWLESAHARQLRVVSVGDPAWTEMFGAYIAEHRRDPVGVSIDVDFNPQTFRDTRELLRKSPNVLIAHFVTPDHQGHAYGLTSQRYRDHLRGYDKDLFALLDSLDRSWTVIVTSDHGAVDSGTHGSDSELQRRTPAFAYGPGIAGPEAQVTGEQIDLAPTLAALLGVPAPAHGQGRVITEWLDLPDEARATAACRNARRVLDYGKVALGEQAVAGAAQALSGCSAGPASARIESAGRAIRDVDLALTGASGISSPKAWLTAGLAVLVLLCMAFVSLGKRVLRGLLPAAALIAATTVLTFYVERLPGIWPNTIRATLFVLGLLPALALLITPARVAALADRHRRWAVTLLAGTLLCTYTTNTQPLAWIGVAILAPLFVLLGNVSADSPPLYKARAQLSRLLMLVAAVAVLHRAAFFTDNIAPLFVRNRALLASLGGVAVIALWLWSALRGRTPRAGRAVLAGTALIAAALTLQQLAFVSAARLSLLALALLAAIALARGRALVALVLLFASYALVSRPWELGTVALCLLLASEVGRALEPYERLSFLSKLLTVVFAFCLMHVERMVLTGSLDFGGMDFGAGGFGDPHVPAWLVGVALTWKYAAVWLCTLLLVLGPQTRPLREFLARGVLLALTFRSAALLVILFVCGSSYWTGFRVLGDLPLALVGTVVAAVAWLCARASGAYSPRSSSS